MFDLIFKKVLKNKTDLEDPVVRKKYGFITCTLGIILNMILAISKLFIGLITKSISIMADAINNFNDAITSIVTIIGFKISSKPGDISHPYGHARIEYLTDLIVTTLVIFICFNLFKESIDKIISNEPTGFNKYILIILSLAIIVKVWQMIFYAKANKVIKSNAISAIVIETRNDVITTSAVLIAAIISNFISFNLDGYVGVAVSLIILVSCLRLLKDVINPLIGTKPDKEFIDRILNKIKQYDGFYGFHDLIIHSYGLNHTYASLHVEMPLNKTMIESHDIIDIIERDFLRDLNIQLVIHIDPVDINDEETNRLKNVVNDIIEGKKEIINIHDFRLLRNGNLTKVFFDVVVNDDFKQRKEDLQCFFDNRLTLLNQNYRAVINIDRIYLVE